MKKFSRHETPDWTFAGTAAPVVPMPEPQVVTPEKQSVIGFGWFEMDADVAKRRQTYADMAIIGIVMLAFGAAVGTPIIMAINTAFGR